MRFSLRDPVRTSLAVVVVLTALACILVFVQEKKDLGLVLFALAAGSYLVLRTAITWAQHRTAIEGSRLRWLRPLGFSVERKGEYWGYKGTYRGYFTRLFIHWDSRYPKRLGPDLWILVYFAPMRRADGKRDIALLRRIEADLLEGPSIFRSADLNCHAIHMSHCSVFTFFTGEQRIRKYLDRTVDKVIEHGLKPWGEAEIEGWVAKSPDLHGPNIHFPSGLSRTDRRTMTRRRRWFRLGYTYSNLISCPLPVIWLCTAGGSPR